MSVFEQLGGEPAVALAVDEFYERVLADPALAHFFVGMNVDSIKHHQRAFFTVLLDGPEAYDGRSMRNAHAGLHITQDDYSATLAHLRATLESLGVEESLIATVARRIELLRAAIVEVR